MDPRVVDVGLAVALAVWALAESVACSEMRRHEHRAEASAERADQLERPDAPPGRGYSVNARIPLEAIRA